MERRSRALTIVIAVAAAAVLWGCNLAELHGRPSIERKPRPIANSAGPPNETVEPGAVIAPGIVEPWGAQVELSGKESGWISGILVREGETVRQGQLLATLDETAQQHNLDLAQADLAEATAALERVERGATPEELRQVQADSEAAAARSEFARASAVRTGQLHGEGVVSDLEADRAQAETRVQAAEAERASARYVELRRGARAEDRAAARARVVAAHARLQVAEDNLARRHVVAPSAGAVLLSRLHVGEFYTAGSAALFILGDTSRLQVRLEVDEIDALSIDGAAPCVLYSDAGARLAEGTIVRLAPKMGRRSLPLESPTARADVRVREAFVEVRPTSGLLPNQRVWGHVPRVASDRQRGEPRP